MNERLSPSEIPMSQEHFDTVLAKVRELTKYDGQHIDGTGSYATRYELPDVDVSIYVPVMADMAGETEPYDDAVRIVVRREEELENDIVIWYLRHYNLHLELNEAEYDESVKAVNYLTGERTGPSPSTEYEEIKKLYELQKLTTSNVFTTSRYDEVMTILDEIRPEHRF